VFRDSVGTLAGLRSALASSRAPVEHLRDDQERKLKRLLVHAYETVPLYRALYDEHGFHPEDFDGIKDLPSVPVLTKDRLRAASPRQRVARGVDLSDAASW